MALAEVVDEEVHHSGPHISSSRREFLRAGLAGFGTLSLPGLLRLRAESAAEPRRPTAVILVWLRGGCSHLDTYDPKPDAPSEYRGPFATDRHQDARACASPSCCRGRPQLSDKFAVLRSMAHTGGGHPAGSLQLLSGDPDPQDKLKPVLPRLHERRPLPAVGPAAATLPNYVGVNPIVRYDNFTIAGPGLPGPVVRAVRRDGRPERPELQVPNIGLADARRGRPAARADRAAQVVRRPPPRHRPVRRPGRDGHASRPRRWTC